MSNAEIDPYQRRARQMTEPVIVCRQPANKYSELEEAYEILRLPSPPEPDDVYFDRAPDGRPTMLYFIHNPITGMIKIGISVEVMSRLRALEAATGCPLVLLGHHYGSRNAEDRMHRRFRNIRQKGEWFTATRELFEMAALFHQRGIKTACRRYGVHIR